MAKNGYRFASTPAYTAVNVNNSNDITPEKIYEQAVAFRDVYEISKSLSLKISVPDGYPVPVDEWKQIHSIPQSLIANLAISNELMIKAILLGSTGRHEKGHHLGFLFGKLDKRYLDYIKKHLAVNGLKSGKWNNVIEKSNNIFVAARYGYESSSYKIDFMTLQLINEALDDIYKNMLPAWWDIKEITDHMNEDTARKIKDQVDLIFNKEYQSKKRLEVEEFQKVIDCKYIKNDATKA